MTDVRSTLNALLRKAAGFVLPPGHPLRDRLAAGWDRVLRATGGYVSVPVAGRKIRLAVECRRLNPAYEAEALDVWLRLLAPGTVAWDIGANFGLYSVLAGMEVGPTGRVTAWEPNPSAAKLVERHLAANGLSGWCGVRGAAVADQPGEMPFSVSTLTDAEPSNRIGVGKHDSTVTVPVEVLDGTGLVLATAVKVDVEGAELLVLRGAGSLCGPAGVRPTFLLAVHPMFIPEFGYCPNDLAEWTEAHQYRSFDMRGVPAPPTDYAEYLLVPAEKVAAVCAALNWPAA